MSKGQLIGTIEQQILKIQSYLFDDYRAQLLKAGVGENEAIVKIINVLRNETFQTYKAKKIELNEKYLKKLRILSILTHFYQSSNYDLIKLSLLLSINKEECLNILLEASINKLISIKINEHDNQITIVKSKVREREINGETGRISSGKLIQIKQKNNRVENYLNKLIEVVNPVRQEQSLGKDTRRHFQTFLDTYN